MKQDQKKMQLEFGKSILKLRKQSGQSRKKLSEMLQIDPRLMAKYELGTTCPSIYAAAKIAQFHCVDLQSLFEPIVLAGLGPK